MHSSALFACSLLVGLAAACAPGPRRPRPSSVPSLSVHDAPAASAADWVYDVTANDTASEVTVRASFPKGSATELSVDDSAEPYVKDVVVSQGQGWRAVEPHDRGTMWSVPSCASGCDLRYRFALADAATRLHDLDIAIAGDHAYVAPPSTWLLRPLAGPRDGRFSLRVATPRGVAFVTGLPASDRDATHGHETYGGAIADLSMAPFSAMGQLRQWTLTMSHGESLDVAVAGRELDMGDDALHAWIARKASVVAAYYGRFPVARALIIVLPTSGARFGFGKTLGNGGASILLPMGRATRAADLNDDWVLVHEMMHLGFPSLGRQHGWFEEGMATYLEPVARARAGDLPVSDVWRGLVQGLPNGLPLSGDEGLERTHTWGRTYWGGALFCLLADIAIREQTHNTRSLDDAMRGVVAAGGTVDARWDVARVIEVGDAATGTAVLADLYRRMSHAPYAVDLADLWKRLGVVRGSGRVTFDDDAPLAYVRQAITAR